MADVESITHTASVCVDHSDRVYRGSNHSPPTTTTNVADAYPPPLVRAIGAGVTERNVRSLLTRQDANRSGYNQL